MGKNFFFRFLSSFGEILLGGCILYLVTSTLSRPNKKEQLEMTLPDISATDYEGNLFEINKLRKTDKTIVFFFSPDCEHCAKEIDELLDNKSVFDKDIRFLFITTQQRKEELGIFFETRPINKMPNTFILLDSGLYYHNIFNVTGSPSVFLFDKSGNLVHKKIGGFSNSILEWL